MRHEFGLLLAAVILASPALAQKAPMTSTIVLPAPPRAEQRPYSYERHGVRIEDPYAWLRDKGYPKVDDKDVLDYLKAENAYFDKQMAPAKELEDKLFNEIKGRIKEQDESVPYRDNGVAGVVGQSNTGCPSGRRCAVGSPSVTTRTTGSASGCRRRCRVASINACCRFVPCTHSGST